MNEQIKPIIVAAKEHLQVLPLSVLTAVVRGKIDLNDLAREELAARGLDENGNWIGFDAPKGRR